MGTWSTRSIRIYDAGTMAKVDTVTLPADGPDQIMAISWPEEAEANGNGTAFYTGNWGRNSCSRLAYDSVSSTASYNWTQDVGYTVGGLSVFRNQVYCASSNSHTVTVVSAGTGAVARTIELDHDELGTVYVYGGFRVLPAAQIPGLTSDPDGVGIVIVDSYSSGRILRFVVEGSRGRWDGSKRPVTPNAGATFVANEACVMSSVATRTTMLCYLVHTGIAGSRHAQLSAAVTNNGFRGIGGAGANMAADASASPASGGGGGGGGYFGGGGGSAGYRSYESRGGGGGSGFHSTAATDVVHGVVRTAAGGGELARAPGLQHHPLYRPSAGAGGLPKKAGENASCPSSRSGPTPAAAGLARRSAPRRCRWWLPQRRR